MAGSMFVHNLTTLTKIVAKAICFLLLAASISTANEYNLHPTKVNDFLYCFFGKNEVPSKENKGNIVNSCYIDGGDGLIAVDTGPTYLYAKESYSIITKLTRKDVKAVVNTHFHDDHLGGNSFFREKKIPIFGHKNMLKDLESIPDRFDRMSHILSREAYKNTRVTLPDHLIDTNTTIKTQNGDILLFHPSKKGHTNADIAVWIPSQRVAIIGDLMHTGMIISIRDGNINGWIDAIGEIRKLDPKIVIGGHGGTTTPDGLTFMYDYLTSIRDGVRKAIDNGVNLEDVTKKIDMSRFDHIPNNKETTPRNIIAVYQMLEMEE